MSENKKTQKIVGIKGMNDILPSDSAIWGLLENTVQSVLKSYGFQQIRTPIVESTALFSRGLGIVSDIVEKEMYSFTDSMNGDELTLRPESTAGIVRCVIEHNLVYDGPKRLWYSGPMFRHERPQRGRYRQFHQIGAEAVGFPGPDIDAELIMLCQRIWDDLGLEGIKLELNSIGNAEERTHHRMDLIAYLEKHSQSLDEDSKRRLYANPLRILDTKNASMQKIVNAAPKLLDYLNMESLDHFNGVQNILRRNNIPFTINPRLVRGMDYYNRTVFEWVTDQLGSQGTVCGGGRYDQMIEMLGGKPTPACGFALGVERLIELMKAAGEPSHVVQCDVYMVHQGEAAQIQSFVIAERLRDAGLDVVLHCASASSGNTFKSQMKKADISGAAFAIILGEDEIASKRLIVKSLRDNETEKNQATIPFEDAVDYLVEQIIGAAEVPHEHIHYHH